VYVFRYMALEKRLKYGYINRTPNLHVFNALVGWNNATVIICARNGTKIVEIKYDRTRNTISILHGDELRILNGAHYGRIAIRL